MNGLSQAIDRYRRVKGLDGHRKSSRRFPNRGDVRREQMQRKQRKRRKLADRMLEQRGGY